MEDLPNEDDLRMVANGEIQSRLLFRNSLKRLVNFGCHICFFRLNSIWQHLRLIRKHNTNCLFTKIRISTFRAWLVYACAGKIKLKLFRQYFRHFNVFWGYDVLNWIRDLYTSIYVPDWINKTSHIKIMYT